MLQFQVTLSARDNVKECFEYSHNLTMTAGYIILNGRHKHNESKLLNISTIMRVYLCDLDDRQTNKSRKHY